MKKKLVGLLGGSFDPIHFGHLNLALEIKEKSFLDEVWLLPAFLSPHKLHRPAAASAFHRLRMAALAVKDLDGFRVLDLEVKKKHPAYTIDTLQEIQKRFPKIALRLLLSQEALLSFSDWKEAGKILKIAPPLVGLRGGGEHELPLKLEKKFKQNLILTRRLEISSTEIRNRLKKKLYCGHLAPKQVLDYIARHHLY